MAARLAVVPMVLEARGLDVTPGTLLRVRAQDDETGGLERILDDEIRHVAIGVKYLNVCAELRGIDQDIFWISLVRRYFRGGLKRPFNDSARSTAGLSLRAYTALAS